MQGGLRTKIEGRTPLLMVSVRAVVYGAVGFVLALMAWLVTTGYPQLHAVAEIGLTIVTATTLVAIALVVGTVLWLAVAST